MKPLAICEQSWVLPFLGLLGFADHGTAADYEVSGEVRGTQHYSTGETKILDSVSFDLYVSGSNWLLHAIPESPGLFGKRLDYWEFASDSDSQYALAAMKSKEDEAPSWQGAVCNKSALTFRLLRHLPMAWFAFGSQAYLDSSEDELVAPYTEDPTPVPMKCIVTRSEVEPRLPGRVLFLSDGYDRRFGTPMEYSPPFDRGFTNADYKVTEWTNLSDLRIPRKFIAHIYRPGPSGLEVVLVIQGSASEIRAGCSHPTLLPRIPAGTIGLIKDLRFVSPDAQQKHPFTYHSAAWLSRNNAMDRPSFQTYTNWERQIKSLPVVMQLPATNRPPGKQQ